MSRDALATVKLYYEQDCTIAQERRKLKKRKTIKHQKEVM